MRPPAWPFILTLLVLCGCAAHPAWHSVAQRYLKLDSRAVEADFAALAVLAITVPDSCTEEMADEAIAAYGKFGGAATQAREAIGQEDLPATLAAFRGMGESAKAINVIKVKASTLKGGWTPK